MDCKLNYIVSSSPPFAFRKFFILNLTNSSSLSTIVSGPKQRHILTMAQTFEKLYFYKMYMSLKRTTIHAADGFKDYTSTCIVVILLHVFMNAYLQHVFKTTV